MQKPHRQTAYAVDLLIFFHLRVMLFLNCRVNKISYGAYNAGRYKNYRRLDYFIFSERVAAESGHYYRGKARKGRKSYIKRNTHFGKSDDVSEKILWRAGDQKQQKGERISL